MILLGQRITTSTIQFVDNFNHYNVGITNYQNDINSIMYGLKTLLFNKGNIIYMI